MESTVYIGKRFYNTEREALRALKKQERRISRKIEKQKAKQLIEYKEDYE